MEGRRRKEEGRMEIIEEGKEKEEISRKTEKRKEDSEEE